jgi:hypothetical protein
MDAYDFYDDLETKEQEKQDQIDLSSWNIGNVEGTKDYELFLKKMSTKRN